MRNSTKLALGLLRRRGGSGPENNLYANLVAYWKLDEASGDRTDSIGGNTLADVNTVTSNTGHVYPLAAEFNATNSEYLVLADSTPLSLAGANSYSWGMWVYWLGSGTQVFLAKYLGESPGYQFFFNGSQLLYQVGGGGRTVIVPGVTTDTWLWVFGYYDDANNTMAASLNNGAPVTRSEIIALGATSAPLYVGAQSDNGYFFNGRIGPVMFWRNYIPTAEERAWLYNNGAGRTLEEMAAL